MTAQVCPAGMAAVAGSYLLETNGFCIDIDFDVATARDFNLTNNTVGYYLSKYRTPAITTAEKVQFFHNDCDQIRGYSAGNGYSGVVSMADF